MNESTNDLSVEPARVEVALTFQAITQLLTLAGTHDMQLAIEEQRQRSKVRIVQVPVAIDGHSYRAILMARINSWRGSEGMLLMAECMEGEACVGLIYVWVDIINRTVCPLQQQIHCHNRVDWQRPFDLLRQVV